MDHIPARKITNRGSQKMTGFFPSHKNERLVAFESLLELDFIYLLEYDNDVLSYKEQPLKISYSYLSKSHKYTPDFFVERKEIKQLVEVKPMKGYIKLLSNPKEFVKLTAAANYCKYNEYDEFLVVTDKEIRSGIKLKNVKYLHSYHNLKVPASTKLSIRNELILNGSLQISQLLFNICNQEDNLSAYYAFILSMLYHHEINTDISSPINKTSYVSF